jgi:ZU5 domain
MSTKKSPASRASCLLAVALCLAACGSKTTATPPKGSQSVDATGGTITLADGASLVIPAGALSAARTITVTSTADVPAGYVGYSALYTFGPAGLQFSKPVQLTLPVHAGATSPAVYWSSASGVGFDELGGTASAGSITTSITHFSSGFVAMAGGPTDGGADASSPADGQGGAAGGTAGAAGGTAGAAGGTAGAAGGAAGAAGGTAGLDGGSVTDAPSAPADGADAGTPTCGAAPLDPITFNFDATMSYEGAGTFTSSGCAGKSIAWSSGGGPFLTNFTDGVTVWVRFDPTPSPRVGDPTFLPTYFAELKPVPGFDKYVGALLWDTGTVATLKAMVPSFNPATMSIITVSTLSSQFGTAPCNVNTGVTYSVPGHAEAVVTYGAGKGLGTGGTSTDATGNAFITLLPASALEYVTVVGTKAGCTLTNAAAVYTGRVPVAPGTTSTALSY